MSSPFDILENNLSIALLVDPITGSIVEANTAAQNFYGYKDLKSMKIYDLNILPSNKISEQISLIQNGTIRHANYIHKIKDGSYRNVSAFTSAIEIDGRKLNMAIIHDISDEKITEKKTVGLLNRYKFLLEASRDGIHIIDENLNIVKANSAFYNILGYKNEESSLSKVTDWDAQWSEEELLKKWEDCYKSPCVFQTKHKKRDGSIIDVELNVAGINLEGQRYLYASSRDISKRIKIEEELAFKETKINTILENSFDAIGVHINGIWTLCNKAALKLFGYTSKEELLGTKIINVIAPSEQKNIREYVDARIKGEPVPSNYITKGIRKDGTIFDLEVSLATIFFQDLLHVIVTLRDVTKNKELENLLRKSELDLKKGEIIGRYGYWKLDLTTQMFEFSSGAQHIYEADEIFLKLDVIRESILPEYITQLDREFNNTVEFNRPYDLRMKIKTLKSHTILDVHSKAEYDPETNILFGSIQNITEQVAREEALRLSEEKFRHLIQEINTGIVLQDADTKILLNNPKALELLGLTQDQLLGRTTFDPEWKVIHEDGSPFPGDTHPVSQAIHTKEIIKDVTLGIYHPLKNEFVWLLVTAVPELDDKRDVRQVIVTFTDITASKRKEKELRDSEANLKNAQHIGRIGNWIWYIQERRAVWSDELYKIFGVKKDLIKVDTQSLMNDRIHPEDKERTQQILSTVINDTSKEPLEYRLLFPDGSVKYLISEFGSVKFDNNGLPFSLSGTTQDITKSKIAELEINRLNKELRDLTKHLQSIRAIERDNLAIEMHDKVGQHLVAFKLESESLNEQIPPENIELIERAKKFTSSIKEVINEFQKIYEKVNPTRVVDLGITNTLQELIASNKGLSAMKVDFVSEIKNSGRGIDFDTNIFRIVEECLMNIAQHSGATIIKIKLHHKNKGIELSVEDNGKGFEYSKIDTADQHGLLEIRERVNNFSGTIKIKSALGKGTKISIAFPLLKK